jgi:putative transposase
MNMKLTRTVKIKLDINLEDIISSFYLYTRAYNTVCEIGYKDRDFNGVSLHHKTYKDLREYLPAEFAITARMKATESLKSIRKLFRKKKQPKCPNSKLCSIRYSKNSYNIWFDKNEISLLTVNGRKRYKINVPEYFKQYLSWRRTSADLLLRKNEIFICIVFTKEINDFESNGKVVGIDRGINKLAVTSDNKFFDGKKIRLVSNRYEMIRSKLQSCGSKSAKRHLKILSGKENRFRDDVNHKISKQIVESLESGTIIVLEDLKSIRQNVRLRKKQRKEIHKWNFFKLEQYITYKAEAKGIKIEFVDSRYTSQKCSICGYISRSNRKSQSQFKCKECNFTLNADLNAARNIKQNYLDAICHLDRAIAN